MSTNTKRPRISDAQRRFISRYHFEQILKAQEHGEKAAVMLHARAGYTLNLDARKTAAPVVARSRKIARRALLVGVVDRLKTEGLPLTIRRVLDACADAGLSFRAGEVAKLLREPPFQEFVRPESPPK